MLFLPPFSFQPRLGMIPSLSGAIDRREWLGTILVGISEICYLAPWRYSFSVARRVTQFSTLHSIPVCVYTDRFARTFFDSQLIGQEARRLFNMKKPRDGTTLWSRTEKIESKWQVLHTRSTRAAVEKRGLKKWRHRDTATRSSPEYKRI